MILLCQGKALLWALKVKEVEKLAFSSVVGSCAELFCSQLAEMNLFQWWGGKLLKLIAKVTIITWVGRTRVFNLLLWRTCATERNWKPVLSFSQLYVQTWSSVFHSFPLLQVRLNSSVEPKCAVWPQRWVEQGQRRKPIVHCKRAFINVLKLRTPGCWAACHKIYNTDRYYCHLGWLIAYVE